MKKVSVFFSVCVLAAGLAACGGSKNPQTETVNTVESQAETGESLATFQSDRTEKSQSVEESTETLQSQKEEKTSGTESADETSMEESEGSEDVYAGLGTWNGQTYSSEAANLTFTMPDSWKLVSGATKKETTSQEFMICDKETTENLSFMAYDLAADQAESVTEQDYLGVIKEQLAASGEQSFDENITEQEIGGMVYYVLKTSLVQNGIDIAQEYYCRKDGTQMYIMILTVPADNRSGADGLISSIQKIK